MTGKRVTRLNDKSEWVIQEVAELSIVPQELCAAAKQRQSILDSKKPALWQTKRPQHQLSGLTKCGVCGDGYSKINRTHYGCSAAKNKGEAVCPNRRAIKREILEECVLSALQSRLMQEDLVSVFCKEYTKNINVLHAQHNAKQNNFRKELISIEKERSNLIQALKDGVAASLVKDDLEQVTARKEKLEHALNKCPEIKPLFHPAMSSRFYQAVKDL